MIYFSTFMVHAEVLKDSSGIYFDEGVTWPIPFFNKPASPRWH